MDNQANGVMHYVPKCSHGHGENAKMSQVESQWEKSARRIRIFWRTSIREGNAHWQGIPYLHVRRMPTRERDAHLLRMQNARRSKKCSMHMRIDRESTTKSLKTIPSACPRGIHIAYDVHAHEHTKHMCMAY